MYVFSPKVHIIQRINVSQGDDAKACNEQLQARGSQACNADSLRTALCQQGQTVISVLNVQLNSVGGSDAGNTAESW